MKKLLFTLTFATAIIFAQAQSVVFNYPNPDQHPGYYVAPVTEVQGSYLFMYSNTVAAKENPSNLYISDRITYHPEYDLQYNALTGSTSVQQSMMVKSRVATKVVFMPDCVQSILYQQYGVSKWKHGTVVRTNDAHVYYEVTVGGKDIRFDDLCSADRIGDIK